MLISIQQLPDSAPQKCSNVLPKHVHLTKQRWGWDWNWDWIYSSSIHTPLWYRTDYSTSGCQSTNPSIHKMHALPTAIATLEVFSPYKHILWLLLPYITRFHLKLHKATPVIRHFWLLQGCNSSKNKSTQQSTDIRQLCYALRHFF